MYGGDTKASQQFRAANNFTGLMFRIVDLTGTSNFVELTTRGEPGFVVMNEPRSGEHLQGAYMGETKVQVGCGGLAIGAAFCSAISGFATQIDSGDDVAGRQWLMGRSIDTQTVASGEIARVILNYSNHASGGAL
jgi:hypothetical protein